MYSEARLISPRLHFISPFIRRPQQIRWRNSGLAEHMHRQTAVSMKETQQLTPQMLNMLLQPQTKTVVAMGILTRYKRKLNCIRNA